MSLGNETRKARGGPAVAFIASTRGGIQFDSLLAAAARWNEHSPESNVLVRGGRPVVHVQLSSSGTVIFVLLLHSPRRQTGRRRGRRSRLLAPILLEILIGSCNLLSTATDTAHRKHCSTDSTPPPFRRSLVGVHLAPRGPSARKSDGEMLPTQPLCAKLSRPRDPRLPTLTDHPRSRPGATTPRAGGTEIDLPPSLSPRRPRGQPIPTDVPWGRVSHRTDALPRSLCWLA